MASSALAQTPPPVPSQEALTAAGRKLIAESGAPDQFSLVAHETMAAVRHDPSGLSCSFPLHVPHILRVVTGPPGSIVQYEMNASTFGETWRIFPVLAGTDFESHFDSWQKGILANNASSFVTTSPSTIEKHPVVELLQSNLPKTIKTGWVELKAGESRVLSYIGVADIGAWRLTYVARGVPDVVGALAPITWVTGVNDVIDYGKHSPASP